MISIFDDNIIWRSYLDKMSGTLENIREPKYMMKAKQYSTILSEIDPSKFEEPSHQKKVREVVLFIKEVYKPNMKSPLKPLPPLPSIIKKKKSSTVTPLPLPSIIKKKKRRRRKRKNKK